MGKRAFQAPRAAALLIPPLLATLATLWVLFATPVKKAGRLPLRMELPASLGVYDSQVILYCQSDQCRQAFPVTAETDLKQCPACGGILALMARSERDVLPPDTQIARRLYRAPGHPLYTVTIVLAGADQRSIHRPQQCLPAQGFNIDRQHVETVRLAPDHELKLVVIDSRRSADPRSLFGFVYWFVGPGKETHSHYERLFWTACDQLFRNTVPRWSYVAVTTSEPLSTLESMERLAAFLRLLVPAITPPAPVES